ncbi:class I tRNA ligase family protein [Salinarimonas sp. NSM]|uniref:class I tRNA ligase family protein n=1 Tax=Salinarimonas sp. NSM TaxID=3458003 RepID=UPI004036F6EE
MLVRRLDPGAFAEAYGIPMQRADPEAPDLRPPFGLSWGEIPPGGETSRHAHHEGELFAIVSGTGTVRLGEVERGVAAGDVILVPPFTRHTLTNTGETPLRFLDAYWEDAALAGRLAPVPEPARRRPVVVTSTPPTPNGDLHLGHLSGPYLGADIHVRYLRMRGVDARHVTGSDDYQSYVLACAERLDTPPAATADRFAARMHATLAAMDIAPDRWTRPLHEEAYRADVARGFERLVAAGHVVARTSDALFCADCGTYLYEVAVRGACPHCAAPTGGNVCEECGRPNACVDVVARETSCCHGHAVTRPTTRLVFPLAPWEGDLRRFLAEVDLDPHLTALCESMMAAGLPEIPVSHPVDWGIPVPVAGFEAQRIWVWLEMALGYHYGIRERGGTPDVVQFFGFDNGYCHALLFPAVAMALGERELLPARFVCNEFLLLDGLKFSTSRNHAVWGGELLPRTQPDVVRFGLSWGRPEGARTNFTLDTLERLVRERLVDGWQAWLDALAGRIGGEADGRAPDTGAWSESHRRFFARLQARIAEIAACFEAASFSPAAAVRALDALVEDARAFARRESHLAGVASRRADRRTALALELAAARALAMASAPVMPRFSARLAGDLGLPKSAATAWSDVPLLLPAGAPITIGTGYFAPPDAAPTAPSISAAPTPETTR